MYSSKTPAPPLSTLVPTTHSAAENAQTLSPPENGHTHTPETAGKFASSLPLRASLTVDTTVSTFPAVANSLNALTAYKKTLAQSTSMIDPSCDLTPPHTIAA